MSGPVLARRGFITGLISFVAAPAIVRVGSLMPVKVLDFDLIRPLYGISPGMQALEALIDHNRIMGEMIKAMGIPHEWLTARGLESVR